MHGVLVDTSVWVDHFRRGNSRLVELLDAEEVLCHPFVLGELACGNLARRDEVLPLLGALTQTSVAGHDEALSMVESHRLMGRGVGWIDVHLLASTMLAGCSLWTLDRRLAQVTRDLGVAAEV
jgi:predicted nucleic acid-binding protein